MNFVGSINQCVKATMRQIPILLLEKDNHFPIICVAPVYHYHSFFATPYRDLQAANATFYYFTHVSCSISPKYSSEILNTDLFTGYH